MKLQGQDSPGHRIDLGIGLASPGRSPRRAPADHQRLRRRGRDRGDPRGAGGIGGRRALRRRRSRRRRRDRSDDPTLRPELGGARHTGQQCRHPACRRRSKNSRPRNGRRSSRINLTAVFHTMRLACPACAQKGWGRIINTACAHSLVASPNKSAYVAAKHGSPASPRRSLWRRRRRRHRQLHLPGYVWTPLVENQIPDTMKARGLTREQVMNDVLLAAQPTKRFVTVDEVAAWRSISRRGSGLDHRRQPHMDGGWTAA